MSSFGYGGGSGGRSYRPNLRFGPAGPVPPVVARLVVANAAVYGLQLLTGDWLALQFGVVPIAVQYGEVWRLFTYQFLHGSLFHLLLNLFVLWMFGSELAPRWGGRFFLRYYFLCAIGGGILFTLANLGTRLPVVGASGAVYGILMAYAMWFPNRQVYLYFVLPVRVRYLIAGFVLIETLQAVYRTGSTVAHTAHLGGMASGYLYLRWRGVSGFTPLPTGTWRRWKKQMAKWRLKRRMRDRGWDDGNNTLH